LNKIFEVNNLDKGYFILYTFSLHLITNSIIEFIITNNYLLNLINIMALYCFIYMSLLILTLILIKLIGYKAKIFLNYLNIDYNLNNIIGHFICIITCFIIILILSSNLSIFTLNLESDDEERVKMLYIVEILSIIIFVFSSIFILFL
jgi:hypothetical protein